MSENTTNINNRLTVGRATVEPATMSNGNVLFSLQPYIEKEYIPNHAFLIANEEPTIETIDDPNAPYSKVLKFTGNNSDCYLGEKIPVSAGERIYLEAWYMVPATDSGVAGVNYLGVKRYDKDKKEAYNNGGRHYVVSGLTLTVDGDWHKMSGYYTVASSHTPYNGSDGGAIRYIDITMILNYTAGTQTIYISGLTIKKVNVSYDEGDTAFKGNVGIGTDDPSFPLHVNGSAFFNTNTGTTPFYIGRLNSATEALSIKVNDQKVIFESIQDETANNYGSFQFILDGETSYGNFDITRGSAGDSILHVDGDGNVGINWSDPQAKLHVRSSDDLFANRSFLIENNTGTDLFFVTNEGIAGFYKHGITNALHITGKQTYSGNYSTLVGHQAGGGSGMTGSYQAMFGAYAGDLITGDSTNSTIIGGAAGYQANAPTNSVMVGYHSGSTSDGNNNTFVGYYTRNKFGSNNVMIGRQAGDQSYGSQNVYIGSLAGYDVGASGNNSDSNVFIGYEAGRLTKDGVDRNIFLGYRAGYNTINLGDGNTVIGDRILQNSTEALTNTVVVGAGSYERFRIDSNGNMGLGSTNTDARLHITGADDLATTDAVLVENDGGTEMFKIQNNGYIGINTTDPKGQLHVSDGVNNISTDLITTDYIILSGTNTAPGQNILAAGNSEFNRGVLKATRSRGSLASPTIPNVNDYIFSFLGATYKGDGNAAGAAIDMFVDGTVTTTAVPSRISFSTTETTTRSERMTIKANGNVGINITTPAAKLHVESDTNAGDSEIFKFQNIDDTDSLAMNSAGRLTLSTANDLPFLISRPNGNGVLSFRNDANEGSITYYGNGEARYGTGVIQNGTEFEYHIGFTSANTSDLPSMTAKVKLTEDRLETANVFRAANFSADPTTPTPAAGDMYFNTTTNKFRGYNGTSWVDLG